MAIPAKTVPLTFLGIGIALIIIGACTPLYVPPATPVPLFDSVGEVQAAGYVGLNGYDLQLAYAPSDHVALSSALSYSPEATANDYTTDHSHLYGEFVGGYDTRFGENFRFNLLAGLGVGTTRYAAYLDDTVSGISTIRARYERYTTQAYLGVRPSGRVEFGLVGRLAYLDFHTMTLNDAPLPNHDVLSLELLAIMKVRMLPIILELQTGPMNVFYGMDPNLGLRSQGVVSIGVRAVFGVF